MLNDYISLDINVLLQKLPVILRKLILKKCRANMKVEI